VLQLLHERVLLLLFFFFFFFFFFSSWVSEVAYAFACCGCCIDLVLDRQRELNEDGVMVKYSPVCNWVLLLLLHCLYMYLHHQHPCLCLFVALSFSLSLSLSLSTHHHHSVFAWLLCVQQDQFLRYVLYPPDDPQLVSEAARAKHASEYLWNYNVVCSGSASVFFFFYRFFSAGLRLCFFF
jgi:hypothetical protein